MTALQYPHRELREKYDEDAYCDLLREIYGDTVSICGLEYDTATALKEVDPIAFRCGLADVQEDEEVFPCPICGEEYADENEALWCCQDEGDFTCPRCDTRYDDAEDADACCARERAIDDGDCPDCGERLIYTNGRMTCRQCPFAMSMDEWEGK